MPITPWRKNPVIYEINTLVWLHELSKGGHDRITLATVPPNEWDAIASLRVDGVWFMGVWQRSPESARIAQEHQGLQGEYRRALPDFNQEDVVGSPYSIYRYEVSDDLGGAAGLATARAALAQRDIRLILDFVPNHMALDHAWVFEHPEYLIQGDSEDLEEKAEEFFQTGERVFAHGRDPYFPPWTDTVQLNGFHAGLRQALIETLRYILDQCDGLRCDMAMLLLNRIFEQTWGQRAGDRPALEFWSQVLNGVREKHPSALFMAEAYWDLEWELQQLGFDYCYDKRLYDRLASDTARSLRLHLLADLGYQQKLVRFIENHDEPRAASTFGSTRSRLAALTIATLPGATLLHEGQLEGRQVKLPVQLRRRPPEHTDLNLHAFYRKLLEVINAQVFRDGEWRLCEPTEGQGGDGHSSLVAWCWAKGRERWVIVVNMSNSNAQGRVHLPWGELAGQQWQLTDHLRGEAYERNGDEMRYQGLYVALGAWGFHCLRFTQM
ncbi:MAG: alpha-amylase [Deltaproteobacteria bacterium]|nr:MAG: alpha-amylase [Deltaproteobacteria bacterium]